MHAFAFRGTVSPAQNKQAVHRHPTAIYGDVATRNQVGREERREWEGTQFFVVVVLQCIGTTHRRLATTPLLRVMFFRHHSPLVDLRGCTRKGRQVDAMWQVCLQGGVDSLTHKFDKAKTFYLNPTHIIFNIKDNDLIERTKYHVTYQVNLLYTIVTGLNIRTNFDLFGKPKMMLAYEPKMLNRN